MGITLDSANSCSDHMQTEISLPVFHCCYLWATLMFHVQSENILALFGPATYQLLKAKWSSSLFIFYPYTMFSWQSVICIRKLNNKAIAPWLLFLRGVHFYMTAQCGQGSSLPAIRMSSNERKKLPKKEKVFMKRPILSQYRSAKGCNYCNSIIKWTLNLEHFITVC